MSRRELWAALTRPSAGLPPLYGLLFLTGLGIAQAIQHDWRGVLATTGLILLIGIVRLVGDALGRRRQRGREATLRRELVAHLRATPARLRNGRALYDPSDNIVLSVRRSRRVWEVGRCTGPDVHTLMTNGGDMTLLGGPVELFLLRRRGTERLDGIAGVDGCLFREPATPDQLAELLLQLHRAQPIGDRRDLQQPNER